MSEVNLMDSAKKLFGYGQQTTTETTEETVTAPEVEVEESTNEEVSQEEEVVQEEVVEQEGETPEPVVTETETPQEEEEEPTQDPVKTKVDYSEWLAANEDKLAEYLTEKKKDYKSLPDSEVLELKLKKDNPSWTLDEVRAELRDKYGVGESKIEVDEDEMTDAEIREAKKHNAEVDRKLRALKTEGSKAKDYFEEYKQSLSLPEFEVEAPNAPVAEQIEQITEEQYIQQVQEYKEKQWVPVLKQASEAVETLTHSIELDDANSGKVALDINYKLSADDKQKIVEHLSDYVAHPSDKRYYKEDGTVDYKTFFEDKGKELFFDKLLRSGIKEAYAKGKKGVIANELLNFDDGGTKQPRDESQANKSELDKVRDYLLNKK